MRQTRFVGIAFTFAAAFAGASCSEPASPARAAAAPRASTAAVTSSEVQSLLVCPDDKTFEGMVAVDSLGSTVEVAGVSVDLPTNAVPGTTPLHVVIPAGNHVRVDISVLGEAHYQFHKPISVTIDYSRCADEVLGPGALTVWYVGDDGTMLERMPTLDDRAHKRVTFLTTHLSGYAIAN